MFSPIIQNLIDALCSMPGIGRKSAQRIAFSMLQKQPQVALNLANALTVAVEKIKRCSRCRNLCEDTLCAICSNPKRDNSTICIVETAMDLAALEETQVYRGHYFVLHGRLSPIDGIGPEEIGIDQLIAIISDSTNSDDANSDGTNNNSVDELILATNLTAEGEATAYYISETCQGYVDKISRIAHGVPLGGELEYVDGNTLAHAFSGRK